MKTVLSLDETREILAQWGLEPLASAPVRAALRVETEGGVFALKASTKAPERLQLLAEAFASLAGRGFHRMAPYLPTLLGEPYVEYESRLWTVSPWREGREPEYGAPGEIARCAATLAAFHRAGLGFSPARGAQRTTLGKWPEKLAGRTGELRSFFETARLSPTPTPFELALREYGPVFLEQAEAAEEGLRRSAFAARCAWAAKARPLAHGDASNRNFILGTDGEAYLLDLDDLKRELPEIDLCRLLRRTLRRVDWDFALGREVLSAYLSEFPLGNIELAILRSLLGYPDKAWRLCKEHYEREDGKSPRRTRKLAQKLAASGADVPRHDRFLKKLDEFYGTCW
ncbi:MAG: phosphotransferase [Chitinophagales bacterium]